MFSGALGIGKGVTAIIGSGGKTSLMLKLAGELRGRTIVATTTRIFPPADMPLVTSPDPVELRRALALGRTVCVGTPAADGKLAAGPLPLEELLELCDNLLVEADGARDMPLKAHADYEPVIPACSSRVLLVVGASGLNAPIRRAVHRPELFCAATGASPDECATPERVAELINREALADTVVINQCDAADCRAVNSLAAQLHAAVFLASVREGCVREFDGARPRA
ncbi:MAG: selenium cofactor biosynthesis protein YqeC [Clostridia bacterium]|nr:selenium cofactor biosynthesis protein YqeC [Clostridia bacterium]